MATVYSGNYSTGTYTYTRVRVDYDGTSATAHLLYTRTNDYAPATTTDGATFTFGGQTTNFTASVSGQIDDYEVASVAFTISTSGGTYSGSTGGSPGPGLFAFSGSVNIPAQSTPPSGLTISAPYDITPTGATFDVSVSSYGSPASASGRWLEAGILGSSSWGNPGRSERAMNAESATITVDNNSTRMTSLTIVANSTYHYGLYAYNTVVDNNTVPGTFTTLAYAPTVSFVSASADSASFSYTVLADGGVYTKTYQYSLDDGGTWTTFATRSVSSAGSGTFSISGLAPGTTYTLKVRAVTTAGANVGEDVEFSTIGPDTPTVVANLNGNIGSITYAIESFNGGTSTSLSLYYNNGNSSNPPTDNDTLLDSRATAGSSTITQSLNNNQRYQYRAVAIGTYSGQTAKVWSGLAYLETPPVTPTITAETISYDSETTCTVRLTISAPADAGYYAREIAYSIGSLSSPVVVGTKSAGDGTAGTYTAEVSQTIGASVRYYGLTTANGVVASSYIDYTPTAHAGPTDVQFSASENNATVKTWLSGFTGYVDGGFFVGSQSQVKITIPEAHTGTTSDGAVMSRYVGSLVVGGTQDSSITINYVSGQDLEGSFAQGQPTTFPTSENPYQNYTVRLVAQDSMYGKTTVEESVLAVKWAKPSVSVSAERLNVPGSILLTFSGEYSRVNFGGSLNNGDDCNAVQLAYRLLKKDSTVLKNWTNILTFSTEIKTGEVDRKLFSGTATATEVDYSDDITVELRATDQFDFMVGSTVLNVWNEAQVLCPAQYDIEVWDWKTNTFLADISYLVIGDLKIDWVLNDVEEVSFDLDLLAFEQKCAETGVDPSDLLVPYAHDIRIRRNGNYILGCNLVQADIQLNTEPPAKIKVKATGYLNLLKDQYILNEAWSGYTYAGIARKLIQSAQSPDCLVKNPTIDVDASYWLSAHGTVSFSNNAHSGGGCLSCGRSGSGWISGGTQLSVDSGEPINIDVWVKGQSGTYCYLRERPYISLATGQQTIDSILLDGSWQHIQVSNYTTFYENGYILLENNRTDSSTNLQIDDCYVYSAGDTASLCNMNIILGADGASATQDNTRQVSYELQNVKDALMDLTQMEDDNFDFAFDYDRTFNIYSSKGSTKADLEILYPGNVSSMTIERNAMDLANKIVSIGSGIGDERLQKILTHSSSRTLYGTHESVSTDNNVSLLETLRDKAVGELYDKKSPTNLPSVKISDGSINPSNVEVGDTLYIDVQGDSYLSSVKGLYRVAKISLSVSQDGVENMDLSFNTPIERPQKKMVRYIRESILGNSVNYSHHWIEVQALVLSGNEYVNVAEGKTVYGSKTFPVGEGGEQAVDNNFSTYAGIQDSSSERRSITIDLGDEFPLDYIKIWHYYEDERTYYGSHLSVGTTLDSQTSTADLEDVLWSYEDNEGWVETSYGKKSKWIQASEIEEG